jgi:hypothetical protein
MTPEGKVQAYLVKRIKALGGETRKVKWTGRRGAPDILVMLPEYPVGYHCFVEVKRPGGSCEPHQLREHESLRKAGFTVLVIDIPMDVDYHFPLPEPSLL